MKEQQQQQQSTEHMRATVENGKESRRQKEKFVSRSICFVLVALSQLCRIFIYLFIFFFSAALAISRCVASNNIAVVNNTDKHRQFFDQLFKPHLIVAFNLGHRHVAMESCCCCCCYSSSSVTIRSGNQQLLCLLIL